MLSSTSTSPARSLLAALRQQTSVVSLHELDECLRRCTRRAGGPVACTSEEIKPIPKHIDGIQAAGEDHCQLFDREPELFCIVLNSRFFPEEDNNQGGREGYADDQSNVTEYLNRRVGFEDGSRALVVVARAPKMGFGRCIISAATPFRPAICGLAPRCPAGGVRSCAD